MKNNSVVYLPSLIVATLLCIAILAGCETSSSDSPNLDISPGSASIPAGTTTNIVFEAINGVPSFSWKVSDNSLGSVTASGPTAIYSSTTNAGQNFVTVTDAESNSVAAVVSQE